MTIYLFILFRGNTKGGEFSKTQYRPFSAKPEIHKVKHRKKVD